MSQQTRGQIYWGLVLLVVGALFLGLNLGLLPRVGGNLWAIVFAVISVMFLAGYVVSGVRNWGLLFPAAGTGAVAAAIWLGEAGIQGELIGSTFMGAIALPFWVAFAVAPRKNWWALIPGWTLLSIAGIILGSRYIHGTAMATLIMCMIGLPFLVVYLLDRRNWWALIPGGVMLGIGLILLLSETMQGPSFASLMMFVIAAPFLIVFLANRQYWWALIPGGVMTVIGLMLLLTNLPLEEVMLARAMTTFMLAGMALLFGLLWLLRGRYPTAWAAYPAVFLGIMAPFGLFVDARNQYLPWAVGLIALGVWLLYRSWRGERANANQDKLLR